jgi:hypothetical protein
MLRLLVIANILCVKGVHGSEMAEIHVGQHVRILEDAGQPNLLFSNLIGKWNAFIISFSVKKQTPKMP